MTDLKHSRVTDSQYLPTTHPQYPRITCSAARIGGDS